MKNSTAKPASPPPLPQSLCKDGWWLMSEEKPLRPRRQHHYCPCFGVRLFKTDPQSPVQSLKNIQGT